MGIQSSVNQALGTLARMKSTKTLLDTQQKQLTTSERAAAEAKQRYEEEVKRRAVFEKGFTAAYSPAFVPAERVRGAYQSGKEAGKSETRLRNIERFNKLYGGVDNG